MRTFDYLVIGAGPAGLQLAYHLEKAGRDYMVLDKAHQAGDFFATFPRHRKLISINKVYTGQEDPEVNLRWDWNSILSDDPKMRLDQYTKEYFPSADDLVQYLNDYAKHFQLKITYNQEVVEVDKKGEIFKVSTKDGQEYAAKVLVMATGIFKPFVPAIPGIEHCVNYTECSVDQNDYNNKRVLILGKGNSAFETADHLVGNASTIHVCSPNSVRLAWKTHFVGHLRAVNNNFLDTYQLKSQNAVLDATVAKIEKQDGKFAVTFHYKHANNEIEEICYDEVIVATGFRFDTSIFSENTVPMLAHNDRFPHQTNAWESVNVKNMYFAGAVTQERDYKKHTSAFIHGFRYNTQALFHLLEEKHEGVALPSNTIAKTADGLAEALMKRVNQNSSLWQQFGFLCDTIVLDDFNGNTNYYETLPMPYVLNDSQWQDKHLFTLTMEYGHIDPAEDIFALDRFRRDEIMDSENSKFLHPIVRHFHMGKLVSKHHLIEVLEANWTDHDIHYVPLKLYLDNELAALRESAVVDTLVASKH